MVEVLASGHSLKYTVHLTVKVVPPNTADEHGARNTNAVMWEISRSSDIRALFVLTPALAPPGGDTSYSLTRVAVVAVVTLVNCRMRTMASPRNR